MKCHIVIGTLGDGVWTGVEPYNYTPYMGLSTQSIGQIPHHSPWGRWGLPLIGALGKAIFLGRVGLDYWVLTIIRSLK